MSADRVILAQLEVARCTAELFLNGVPLLRIAPGDIPIENVAAEGFIVPGTNFLELLVEPGSSPSSSRTEYRELSFRPMRAVGRLLRFPDGVPGLAPHGELLGETIFAWDSPRPSRRAFPAEVGAQIELHGAHGRWAWQDAEPLELDEALVAEACALLDDVERAIRRGDKDRLWQLLEHQTLDAQRAYPALSEAGLRAELGTMLNHARKAADPVLTRDRAAHDFRLVAGGLMLELVDHDYSTTFKLRDPGDGSATPYRILAARIDGKLRIVR
jgi:hypothetical protein